MPRRAKSLPPPLRLALTAARQSHALTQSQLGALVGLPQTHISSIESGRVVPRYDTLLDLVRVLDLDLVLVPRPLVPLVEAVIRHNQPHGEPADLTPLYQLDPDSDETTGATAKDAPPNQRPQ